MFNDHLIPVDSGQAVSRGWPSYCPQPVGVTWHWTATWDLATCRMLLGGPSPQLRGQASAHFGVGRTVAEGIDRYVTLDNRSWHAGKNQSLRWDGLPTIDARGNKWTGARTTIGIETVHIGYARSGVQAQDDWTAADDPGGRQRMLIQPWTEPQIEMMVALGRFIQIRHPNFTWKDHHGHADLCPGYKVDVAAFPMARVLRKLYPNADVPDIWTPYLLVEGRQRVLATLGYNLGSSGPGQDGVDGAWGRRSDTALRSLQSDNGLVDNGYWTQSVSLVVHELTRASRSSS